jgi:hypothetical protein
MLTRLFSGNSHYLSVQNILPSRLISRNINSKIYKIIILPVVLYGPETLSLTSREGHRLWALDKDFGARCSGLSQRR